MLKERGMLKGIVKKRINRKQIFDIHHVADSLVHVLVFLSRAAQLSTDLLDNGDATTHGALLRYSKSKFFDNLKKQNLISNVSNKVLASKLRSEIRIGTPSQIQQFLGIIVDIKHFRFHRFLRRIRQRSLQCFELVSDGRQIELQIDNLVKNQDFDRRKMSNFDET